MNALVIANTQIRQDVAGRYCLNDLHQASGGAKRHQPANWLRLDQARELVSEVERVAESEEGLLRSEEAPVAQVNDGFGNGTYAIKELVYAYAMWISAAFHLHVIRAYDALVTGQGTEPEPPPMPLAPQHRADVLVSASRSFAALARTGRTLRMGHARALAAANAATLRATGVDLIAELDAADLLMDAGPAALGHDGSGADLAKVSAWLEGRAEVTTREVIAGALDGNPDDRSLQMRTAALMRTLGWRNIQVRRGLARHRVYQRRE